MEKPRWVQLFGVSIDPLDMRGALDAIARFIEERRPRQAVFLNAAKVVEMGRNPTLLEEVKKADLLLADGQAVVWAARFLGKPLPARVAGVDLMTALLKEGAGKGWRFYFLGARPDVLERAVANCKKMFPNVAIAGYRDGYFTSDEEAAVVNEIKHARPDILFLGFGSPKKELFAGDYLDAMAVPFTMGVGGSFDILAGETKRAPELLQRMGLEWLYRFAQEPRRMWRRYLVGNTLFVLKVLGIRLFGERV